MERWIKLDGPETYPRPYQRVCIAVQGAEWSESEGKYVPMAELYSGVGKLNYGKDFELYIDLPPAREDEGYVCSASVETFEQIEEWDRWYHDKCGVPMPIRLYRVTHWMPLPEPPEDDDDEDEAN